MHLEATRCELRDIQIFRTLFLTESNTQIRYDARHERGWSDSYLLFVDNAPIGYGSVTGQELSDRDTIFEFYIVPPYRNLAQQLFRKLWAASGVKFIECQTNDSLLHSLTLEFSKSVSSSVILFSDHTVTHLYIPALTFRQKTEADLLFKHQVEPEGSHVIEWKGEVIATGGFLLHYNVPFCDLYMEVREDARKKGVGSYLIQELKKECYRAGRIPAARCNIENHPSRATLLKAGMKVSGFMVLGTLENANGSF